MRSDLQALEITLGELKRLTTFNLKEIVVKGKKEIKETINIFSILIRWLLRILGVIAFPYGLVMSIVGLAGAGNYPGEQRWIYFWVELICASIGIFLIIFSVSKQK